MASPAGGFKGRILVDVGSGPVPLGEFTVPMETKSTFGGAAVIVSDLSGPLADALIQAAARVRQAAQNQPTT